MNNPYIHLIPFLFAIIYFSIIYLLHWKLNLKYLYGLLLPLFMTIVMNLMAIPSYVRLITGDMGDGDWILIIFALWQLGILIIYVLLWKLIETFASKKESE